MVDYWPDYFGVGYIDEGVYFVLTGGLLNVYYTAYLFIFWLLKLTGVALS